MEKKNTLFAVQHRLSVILLITVLTTFFSIGFRWLHIEPNLASVLPKTSGKKANSSYSIDEGNDNPTKSIFIIFDTRDGVDFFSPKVLEVLSSFHNELLFKMGIPRASILDIINTFNDFENIPFTPEVVSDFKKQVLEAPFISQMFMSDDQKATIVSIIYKNNDFYKKSNLCGRDLPDVLEKLMAEYSKNYPFLDFGISGTAMVEEKIISYMKKDLSLLFPMTIFVIFVLLVFLMRSFCAAIFPLIVAFISVVWTLGLKGWIGSQLTLVEAVLPILLTSVSCADGVHIMNDVIEHLRRQCPLTNSITITMRRLRVPIILTSITTGLGFMSLLTASSEAFRNLGIFMTFGVSIAMGFSLWGVPAVLSLLPLNPSLKIKTQNHNNQRLASIFVFITSFLLGYKKTVSSILLAVFGISVYSLWTINIDFDEVAFLKKSTEVRQIADNIQNRFGGYGIILLTLNKKDGSDFRNLNDLSTLGKIEEAIKEYVPNTSFVTSVNFIIKGVNYKLRGQDPSEYKVVENPIILRQILNLIDRAPALSGSLPGFVNNEWKTMYITIRIKYLNSIELKKTASALEPLLSEVIPSNIAYNLGGDYKRLMLSEVILNEQTANLISSLVTIFLVMLVIFRSFSNGIVVIFPILWATFFNFLFMKIMGIPLNPGTAMVASIGMGVGVDYTIHYFSAFRWLYREKQNYREAILQAIRQTFQGIIFNAIAVSIGFTVLLVSSYEIIMLMSIIITFTMITTALSSLTILPIFLDTFKPKVKL